MKKLLLLFVLSGVSLTAQAGENQSFHGGFGANGNGTSCPPAPYRNYTPPKDARPVMGGPSCWETTCWDDSTYVGRLHNRTKALSQYKESWHLYIRGVGPAIHERPVARPCW